jgi:hypothetical protein
VQKIEKIGSQIMMIMKEDNMIKTNVAARDVRDQNCDQIRINNRKRNSAEIFIDF